MANEAVKNIPFKISERDIALDFISLNNSNYCKLQNNFLNLRDKIRKSVKGEKDFTIPVFRYITKYLLTLHHEDPKKYTLYDILKFLKIYSVLYCSVFYYKDDESNPFFKFIDSGLTVDKILNIKLNDISSSINSSLVEVLDYVLRNEKITDNFETIAIRYNEYKPPKKKKNEDNIEEENIDENEKSSKNKTINTVNNILLCFINYFNIKVQLTSYFKNSNRITFDRLICEYNYSNDCLHEYTIKIDEKEYPKFKDNCTERYKDQLLLISCLIDDAFRNDNLDFNKPFNVESLKYYYNLTKGTEKMQFSTSNFMSMINNSQIEIIKDNIVEFNFIWTDKDNITKTYNFSKDGIKEVK